MGFKIHGDGIPPLPVFSPVETKQRGFQILERFTVSPFLSFQPSRHFTPEQRTALFQMAYDQLLASKSSGGALVGVMFWNAAMGYMPDDG